MGDFSLDELRLAISLVIIGQQLLIAIVMLKGRPIASAQWLGALLILGAICYLIQSNPILRTAFMPIRLVVVALSIAVPYLLWEFSIAIFETQSVPRPIRFAIYVVPVFLWLVFVSGLNSIAGLVASAEILHQLVALVVIALTITSIYGSRRDDLLEPRRRYRNLFVLFIALQAGGVIIVELLLGYSNLPDWLELTNVIMIGILTLGLTLPLLMLDGGILWRDLARVQTGIEKLPEDSLSPANRVLRNTLNNTMQGGFYRTPGLGIRELADELNVPEHQLRKLINQNLGYRNFVSYLNQYRIREARDRLSSAESVRIPVLTIAMDLGYGSIGPFNRAFKETTGVTPTTYRRQHIGKSLADSE